MDHVWGSKYTVTNYTAILIKYTTFFLRGGLCLCNFLYCVIHKSNQFNTVSLTGYEFWQLTNSNEV